MKFSICQLKTYWYRTRYNRYFNLHLTVQMEIDLKSFFQPRQVRWLSSTWNFCLCSLVYFDSQMHQRSLYCFFKGEKYMKGSSGRKDIFQISHYFKIGESDLEKLTFFFFFFLLRILDNGKENYEKLKKVELVLTFLNHNIFIYLAIYHH